MSFPEALFAPLRGFCIFASLFCLVTARDKLPENFQVDLIFPQPNTTYAPTQWFPIVFGIQNAQKLWPLPFSLTARVADVGTPREESQRWQSIDSYLSESDIGAAIENTPGNLYFHIFTVNMTNATTSTFYLEWTNVFMNRCRDNEEELRSNGSDILPSGTEKENIWIPDTHTYQHWIKHWINFSTAPEGVLPDIKAVAEQCQHFENNTTDAVRITDVISRRGTCPFFETDFPGTNCNYRPIAKELAANTSSILLGTMGCEEGDWRNITAPCSRNQAAALSAPAIAISILVPVALICTIM